MRDQLLATVKARLERIKAVQDPALALEPGALEDAQRLAEILADADIDAHYVLGWFHWYRYLALSEDQEHESLEELTRVLTLCFITGVEVLPEPLLTSLAENAVEAALTLLEEATSTSDPNLITATVSLWQRVSTIIPIDHSDRAMWLSNLGIVLQAQFNRAGVQADLDEAIMVGREAVQTAPADHPDRAIYLSNLGTALRVRFERSGAQADLDEAITVGREAVQTAPADHPDRAVMLTNLGIALQARFDRVGAQADLDEAIMVGREAVQATPANHRNRAGWLSNLGTNKKLGYWTSALIDECS